MNPLSDMKVNSSLNKNPKRILTVSNHKRGFTLWDYPLESPHSKERTPGNLI